MNSIQPYVTDIFFFVCVMNIIYFYFTFFLTNQFFQEKMTIIFTKFLRNEWNKSTMFLCYKYIRFLMCRTSPFVCQMTMTFNLLRIYLISTKSAIFIIFEIFSSSSVGIRLFICLWRKKGFFFYFHHFINLHYLKLEEIQNTHFVRRRYKTKLCNNHHIQDFV